MRRRLNIEIHRLYEIHSDSPRTNKPRHNCFVIDMMCLLFSAAFNKRASISLSVVCLYTRVLDFKVKDQSRWGNTCA